MNRAQWIAFEYHVLFTVWMKYTLSARSQIANRNVSRMRNPYTFIHIYSFRIRFKFLFQFNFLGARYQHTLTLHIHGAVHSWFDQILKCLHSHLSADRTICLSFLYQLSLFFALSFSYVVRAAMLLSAPLVVRDNKLIWHLKCFAHSFSIQMCACLQCVPVRKRGKRKKRNKQSTAVKFALSIVILNFDYEKLWRINKNKIDWASTMVTMKRMLFCCFFASRFDLL